MSLHEASPTGAQRWYLHKGNNTDQKVTLLVTTTTAASVPSRRYHFLLQHWYLPQHEACQVPPQHPSASPTRAQHGYHHKDQLLQQGYLLQGTTPCCSMNTCLYTGPTRYQSTRLYTKPTSRLNMRTFTKVTPNTAAWVSSQRYHFPLQHGYLPLHEASPLTTQHASTQGRPYRGTTWVPLQGNTNYCSMGTFSKGVPSQKVPPPAAA